MTITTKEPKVVVSDEAVLSSVQGRGKGKPRGCTPEPPYAWFSKLAVDRIRKSDIRSIPCALSVYFALCEQASDSKSNTFQAGAGLLAYKAGICKRSVRNGIIDLVKAKVIKVRHNKLKGQPVNDANTFSLLSVRGGIANNDLGHTLQQGAATEEAKVLPSNIKNTPRQKKRGVVLSNSSVDENSFLHPADAAKKNSSTLNKPEDQWRHEVGRSIFNTLRDQAESAGLSDNLKTIVKAVMVSHGTGGPREIRDAIQNEVLKQWTELVFQTGSGMLRWSAKDKRIELWAGDGWAPLGPDEWQAWQAAQAEAQADEAGDPEEHDEQVTDTEAPSPT